MAKARPEESLFADDARPAKTREKPARGASAGTTEGLVDVGDGVMVSEFHALSVRIDETNLNAEFIRQPADLASWGERYSQAYGKYLLGKRKLKEVRSRAFIRHKEAPLGDGEKAPSEKTIEARMELDEDVMDAEETLRIYDAELERLKRVLEAVRSKRDMLISLGAQHRAERLPGPSLRDEEEREDRAWEDKE